jgi:dienelactone hydrolase
MMAYGDEAASARWIDRFRFTEPLVEASGVCEGTIGALPAFTVTSDKPGTRLVRVSLPFAPASLPVEMGLTARAGTTDAPADVRGLTRHPGQPSSVRRAIVTFPFAFADTNPVSFSLILTGAPKDPREEPALTSDGSYAFGFNGSQFAFGSSGIVIETAHGPTWRATLLAPSQIEPGAARFEVVESSTHYLWVRLLAPDTKWPRIIEVRASSDGTVILQLHVQRLDEGDAYAPDLGWRVSGLDVPETAAHSFSDAEPYSLITSDSGTRIDFPVAPMELKGNVTVEMTNGAPAITYWRCRDTDKVPFQSTAWRRAAIAIGPSGATPLNALLEPSLKVHVSPADFDAIYGSGLSPDLSLHPLLDDAQEYHRDAMVASALRGDDYGNVTGFNPGGPAGYYGMNRLNHCPGIFEESYRASSSALRETAVAWCSNMHDLSLWWGDTPDFGGTRYNAAVAAGEKEHEGDTSYLWRTNWSSHFCTKGYDSFFYAYEETGDPRMLPALNAQVNYAKDFIHTNTGECRNIGDAIDYMRLYQFTGVPMYRDEALRLFRELREKLSTGDLFDQGGKPIPDEIPFIDEDQRGLTIGYAKPYIIGYALAGLPDLLDEFPDEPKLRDVVRAVADFMAESQDPVGGWRYPHPQSSSVIISQGLEHAAQLVRAATALEAQGEDTGGVLNAIERVLQARIEGLRKSGAILGGLTGWERSTNAIPEGKTIYDLYQIPADRDPTRDFTEGAVGVGGAPPDGLVYWGEVMQFYLKHRPAERLFHTNEELGKVLARVDDRRLKLTPQNAGSYLRVEHPDNPAVGFTLWAPEWVSFPNLGYSHDELGGMKIDWRRDDRTGAVSYTIDRPTATFTAQFTPYVDYVECAYTVWPKPDAEVPESFGVGPCQQMKGCVFEGDEADLLTRMWFLSEGSWTGLASCAEGNPRNVQYVIGGDSPEMSGAMAESGWKTIQNPRPDVPLIACVSTDGAWVAATAGEFANSICNNAAASHRCMHSQGSMPLNPNGPTTMRVNAYLIKGSLDEVKMRYARDAARWKNAVPSTPQEVLRTAEYGLRDFLPSFSAPRVRRMGFSSAWEHADTSFDTWRINAREAYLETLQTPPPRAPFAAEVIDEEDRGEYIAQKLALNISADERVKAYLLIPKGKGPFPALVALHDHGAHFSIGKEKVIRPLDESEERLADAVDWITKYYGGNFIGDEMAKRGYVVFATDALFWGDRGRFGGVLYEDQQALGANMLQLGQSWAGTIVWDDIRSAEFVQSLPQVDPERIGCMGLSMGAHRTWSLAAATDIIKAGAAICWMGDTPTLMSPGNNQTVGYSSMSMILPGIREILDYPDVASIACPKPMLFFNGTEDGLFPVPGVEASYGRMGEVWASQNVNDRLLTKLWPVPHEFNAAMQAEAFDWLDRWLNPGD